MKQGPKTKDSLRQAIKKYEEALPLFRTLGARSKEAYILSITGELLHELGDDQLALDRHNRALPLWRVLGNRIDEATTLNDIAAAYNELGEKQKALDFFNQALSLHRTVENNQRGETTTLQNIAAVYSSLGEIQKSLDILNQAIPLFQSLKDNRGEATALNNAGLDYHSLGEAQKALDFFNLALPLRRTANDPAGEATTLNNIGLVYFSLGDKQKALDFFNQALTMHKSVGSRQGEAVTLSNIGAVHYLQGEKQKAADFSNQVLTIYRELKNSLGEALTLGNIGVIYRTTGQYQKALDFLNQARSLHRKIGDRYGEVTPLHNIGLTYQSLGETQKALDSFKQALALGQDLRNRRMVAETHYKIARLERDMGNLAQARSDIEAGINVAESLRLKITSPDLRASYFASAQDYYEFKIDLLMQLHKQQPLEGHSIAAFHASEQARARSLLDLLVEARADIRHGADQELISRERILQHRLNAKAQILTGLIRNARTAEATAMEKEINSLSTELQNAQTEIRQKSPRYAALTQPQPLRLSEIQAQVLDADTLLLQYSLGKERSYLWAVTPTTIDSYELPKREVIEAAAQRVYGILTSPKGNARDETDKQRALRQSQANEQSSAVAAELSRMLLAPVAQQLGKKRLVIVADGGLHYLPFGALPDPNKLSGKAGDWQPLVVEHEIANLPSASTLAVLRQELKDRQPAPKALAVIADPVFTRDDERIKTIPAPIANRIEGKQPEASLKELANEQVTRKLLQKSSGAGELNINRLKFTREEAERILALVPAREGMKALDFAANRALVESDKLNQYRYVHFATHGLADSERSELSTIVLSLFDEQGKPQDGFLRAHEVYNLNLPAELVVLSACETGLGKQVKGEGLVSLTRGFMYAGAARVVVSLWSVNDKATAELMTNFYRKMLVEGQRPAAALRAAQIEMWRDKRWEAPYYWAAFTLQGEWR
jgi:CHAT domain-containing protein/Tfp pilus assembly protein PilF